MAPFVPDHVVQEILSNLPVKTLLCFKCVCKSWRDLLCDPYFVSLHFRKSARLPPNLHLWHSLETIFTFDAETPRKYLLKTSTFGAENPKYLLKTENQEEIIGLFFSCYLCSCDGFVFFLHADDKKTILVVNPSTKSHVIVTQERVVEHLTGFTVFYDPNSCCYEIITLEKSDDTSLESTSKVMIYNFANNTWENTLGDIPYAVLSCTGILFKGELYWTAEPESSLEKVLLCFSPTHGNFKEIKMPDKDDARLMYAVDVTILENCLCVIRAYENHSIVAWLMKESWTKLFVIENHGIELGIVLRLNLLCRTQQGKTIFDVWVVADDLITIVTQCLFYDEETMCVEKAEFVEKDPHTGFGLLKNNRWSRDFGMFGGEKGGWAERCGENGGAAEFYLAKG